MRSANSRLFGVRAIVFGAASGIGEAVARTYSKHGARVLAVDDGDVDPDRHFHSVAGIDGLSASPGDPDAARDAIGRAVADFGGLDVVVNSFALQPPEPLADAGAAERAVSERLQCCGRLFDLALPQLKKSPSGRVITIGLVRSAFAGGAALLYGSAEQALADQTRVLAAQAGQFGITVNYVQPGAVMTAESRRVYAGDTAFRDDCIRGSAAGRLGDPIDVARVALFLASDDAAFVSGTGVRVDGGPR